MADDWVTTMPWLSALKGSAEGSLFGSLVVTGIFLQHFFLLPTPSN